MHVHIEYTPRQFLGHTRIQSALNETLIFSIPVVIILVFRLIRFMVAIVGIILFSETEIALFDSSDIDKDLFHVCELVECQL